MTSFPHLSYAKNHPREDNETDERLQCSTQRLERQCSTQRLERQSSLLTCCPKNTDEANKLTGSSLQTLSLPALRMKHRSSDTFLIRDSRRSVAAIGQYNGKQNVTLFYTRPLSPGQPPSLTMGGRILYKLGDAVVQADNYGTLHLWNGQLLVVDRHSDGSLELIRPDEEILPSDPISHELLDEVLTLCMEAIFEKVCSRSGYKKIDDPRSAHERYEH